ncbi:NFACT RNA binding domain-containing protein [Clostridium sp. BJN0001]|uniref:Rqc2 family fibronectin-binding protein n=1 Tax=Clostridium sp. BJN0001 TaxID=2930219 RepID=UPI001FD0BCC3|nr:NFACT RNA binding domain-containing protein [Clostridium sp. BJN0001]
MALDGMFLHSLISNISDIVIDSKIDKINQPEKDEIILTLRKNRKNYKLLVSSSPQFARIHITDIQKENPIKAPMYLMVLRKYIMGGIIKNIYQKSNDRIVIIDIQNSDELGFNSMYSLIIEIMGRHSNITLVRERDRKIMECIKHITADMNSYRVLYPGIKYINPPESKKLNPFDFTFSDFSLYISKNELEFNQDFFLNTFTGISRLFSNNLYEEFKMDNDLLVKGEIYDKFKSYISTLDEKISYNLYTSKMGLLVDFYFTHLPCLEKELEYTKYENPNKLLDDFYSKKDKQDRILSRSSNLQKLIHTNLERCIKKSKILNKTLKECTKKETYRLKGDLLTSNIYKIKRGDSQIKVLNYYNEESEEYIIINLDSSKSPSYNIQRYYKKYNKLKASEKHASMELNKNNEEENYLNSVLTNILNAEDYKDIDEIKNELIQTGYIKFKKKNKGPKVKESKPHHFISSDGIDIFVGRNNIQNDNLSLKSANKNYMWLHTKNLPGSHVIIASYDIPDNTLLEAAIIASYYSKGKNSPKQSVDYTKVKELRKPSGAKPGMVIYHTNKTITVNPADFSRLKIKHI